MPGQAAQVSPRSPQHCHIPGGSPMHACSCTCKSQRMKCHPHLCHVTLLLELSTPELRTAAVPLPQCRFHPLLVLHSVSKPDISLTNRAEHSAIPSPISFLITPSKECAPQTLLQPTNVPSSLGLTCKTPVPGLDAAPQLCHSSSSTAVRYSAASVHVLRGILNGFNSILLL